MTSLGRGLRKWACAPVALWAAGLLGGCAPPGSSTTGSTGSGVVIGLGGFAPVADVNDTFVGKVQDEINVATPPNDFNGTGSLIAPGKVLTCAHVLGIPNVNTPHFERFRVANNTYVALGVGHPGWHDNNLASPFNMGQINDVALLLIPNQAPAAPLGTLATGQEMLGVGMMLDIVGFASSQPNPDPLLGHATLFSIGTELLYDNTVSGSLLEHGDSGGPTLFTFPGNQRKILGVHHGKRDPGVNPPNPFGIPVDIDMTVSRYLDFIDGNGAPIMQGGVPHRVLNRVTQAGVSTWNNAAWARGNPPQVMVPLPNDVAILDPTALPDGAGTVVTINAATNNLDGLLNDSHLVVNANLTCNGGTGGLNTGTLEVAGAAASFGASLDNQGLVTMQNFAMVSLGAQVPNMTPGRSLNNDGTIQVGTAALLVVSNGAFASSVSLNQPDGTIDVTGGQQGLAAASLDVVENKGRIRVFPQGQVTVVNQYTGGPQSLLQVESDVMAGVAQATLPIVDNGGELRVGTNNGPMPSQLTIRARRAVGRPGHAAWSSSRAPAP